MLFLTREVFTFGMNPAVTLPTLHHLAFVVVVIIALVTEGAEVPCKEQKMRRWAHTTRKSGPSRGCGRLTKQEWMLASPIAD